jgi:hypothetical protein
MIQTSNVTEKIDFLKTEKNIFLKYLVLLLYFLVFISFIRKGMNNNRTSEFKRDINILFFHDKISPYLPPTFAFE